MSVKRPESEQYMAFDHYQRYRLASDVISNFCEQAGIDLAGLKVLDLGGIQGFLRAFLPPEVHITTANLERSTHDRPPGPQDSYVLIKPGPLPFDDGSFDMCVSCDVLEHVADAERKAFVGELARVCRRAVLLTAPFDTEGVRQAEALIGGIYQSVFHEPYAWLKEHKEQGLPSLDAATAWFGELFSSHEVLPSSYVPHWLFFMTANIVLARHPRTAILNNQLTDIYAALYYFSDQREPSYRHLLLGIKEGPKPDLSPIVEARKDYSANGDWSHHLSNLVVLGALREQAEKLTLAERAQALSDAKMKEMLVEKQRLERELEQNRQARAHEQAQLKEAVQNRDQISTQMRKRDDDIKATGEKLAQAEKRLKDAERELLAARKELQELREARDQENSRWDKEVQELKASLASADTARLDAEKEAQRLLAELEHLRSGLDNSARLIVQAREERDEARNRIAELEVTGKR
jgi:hypothetical protein